MNKLYPLKFAPICKEKIWGGTKIRSVLGHEFSPLSNCGEMWVLSGVEGEESIVSGGFLKGNNLNELVEVYMGDLVGERVFDKYGEIFPILVKFIDTNDYLSIQVHPDDELALRRYGDARGKTEMWHILDAEPGAELINGFKRNITRDAYIRHLENGSLKNILNTEKVSPGDTFFIPAGRIHAIGNGILLAEIQQTSDTTYRIYDWDRIGADGLPRELHTEDALDAIDFSGVSDPKIRMEPDPARPVTLVECPQFITRLHAIQGRTDLDYSDLDSFVALVCTEGEFGLRTEEEEYGMKRGEAILLPAEIHSFELVAAKNATFLEVFCS